jgi:hypothetical protein
MGEAKPNAAPIRRRIFASGVEFIRRIGGGMVEVGFYQNVESNGRMTCEPAYETLVLPLSAVPHGVGLALMVMGHTVVVDECGTIELTH